MLFDVSAIMKRNQIFSVVIIISFHLGLCRVQTNHEHLGSAWTELFDKPNLTETEGTLPTVPNVHCSGCRAPMNGSPKLTASYCQGCSIRRAELEATLTNNEITALRIERVKQQILNKLRLTKPPNVGIGLSGIPKPLIRAALVRSESTSSQDDVDVSDVDHFYGTTDQVILFPQEESSACASTTPERGSACFTFHLPASLETEDVTVAQLWVYKGANDSIESSPTYLVSQIVQKDGSTSTTSKIIAAHKTSQKDGWFKIDLASSVKEWLGILDLNHTITVDCSSCNTPVGSRNGHRPFLVINTAISSQKSRSKRQLNCFPGTSECCREKLYISFADIGWDDWIIQPTGYDAYYCRGSCSSAASLTVSGSHYNTIIRKYLRDSNSERSIDLVPCCTATRLSSLQLLYLDNNKTITKKTLPNMIVSSCGCM